MIVANWKMHGSKALVEEWINTVSKCIKPNPEVPCVFCPPSLFIDFSRKLIDDLSSEIKLGSQLVNSEDGNALTGGINSKMLTDFSTDYVLIGHSEQREFFNEQANQTSNKIKNSIDAGLSIIFCIGESLDVQKQNGTNNFIATQLEILKGLNLDNVTIAYEPVWAIGTGLNADKRYIEEVHKFIKDYCETDLNAKQNISVVYGGSVKSENAEEILSSGYVDGLLIGGASLNPDDFSNIYNLS